MAKIMQTSAKEACYQIAECSLSYCKGTQKKRRKTKIKV